MSDATKTMIVAALIEAEREVVQVKNDLVGARADNFQGTAHPKFDDVSNRELARIDAMLGRIRAAIALTAAKSELDADKTP